MPLSTPPASAPVHALQCLEVWGGFEAVQRGVSVPGIDAWITSQPYHGAARGGDIHYVSMCGAGRISRFALCDVSGHGADVAAVAGRLRALMRRYIGTLDQTRFAQHLNHDLFVREQNRYFATGILLTYFAPTDHLIILNAGHPRPLWYRADLRKWTLLHDGLGEAAAALGNLPLGVVDSTDFVQFAIKLQPADLVMLYTDALTETKDASGSDLGESGLLRLVRELGPLPPQHLVERIVEELDRLRDGAAPRDDQTLLLLHHTATDPPAQSISEKMRIMGRMLGLPV